MTKKVDGEFEILMGNKQLVATFFVVVVLLGVFFTLGYMLGQRSMSGVGYSQSPSKGVMPAAAAQPEGLAEARSQGSSQQPDATGVAQSAENLPAMTDTQSQREPLPTDPSNAPVAARSPAAMTSEPPAGRVYLQVTAARRPDAELVASVLKQKGLPAILAPGPTEAVFRVLVGPLADATAVAKARAKLELAGFKPFVRKY